MLERTEPAYKSQSAPVNLPKLPNDLFAKGEKILSLAACGEISVDIAKELLASVSVLLKSKEQTDLEKRLATLEKTNVDS